MSVEVKIHCDCGTKYKFDVEPLHGRLPARVHCPGCGFEGTDAANAQLRQILAPRADRLAKTAPLPHAAVVQPTTEPRFVELEPAPSLGTTTPKKISPSPRSEVRGRFVLGALGAVLAGAVACVGWFFLIKVTGYQIGFAAWGVGLLIGLGARALGREGSPRLALVAGGCAGAAILGGQLMAHQARAGSLAHVFADGGLGALTLLWLLLAVASAWRLGRSGVEGREGD